ncbi:hypothetical protein AZF37_04640 [endosymbiont 'TC1' of Trimyema compressum]|uniref:DNA translocase FtsK n=1 Tax=endosymbiont 'TC1' of Trimyema compressum TaxID=243899 RepID=UPI0007F0928B|nr:DNA translocase FtsK [endosymbiont 'TC1' of Trimyema compressum]AMP20552.1 hypothetical protein AZF37_04640 [endosymbiont 'TC1' of Trimyema compressum]
MARKKNKKKVSENKQSIYYIILIILGIFFLLGYFFSTEVGIMGTLIINGLGGLFGGAIPFVSFLVLVVGLYGLLSKKEKKKKVYISIFLFFVAILISFQLPYTGPLSTESLMTSFLDKSGGGIVGAFFTSVLFSIVGAIGLYMFLFALYIVSIVLLINGLTPLKNLQVASSQKLDEIIKDRDAKKKILKQEKEKIKARKRAQKNKEMLEASKIRQNMLNAEDYGKKPKEKISKHSQHSAEMPKPVIDIKEEPLPTFGLEEELESIVDSAPVAGIKDNSINEEVNPTPEKDWSTIIPGQKKHGWKLPPLSLLTTLKKENDKDKKTEIEKTATLLEETLKSFGVSIQVTEVSCGPSLTRYEAVLAPGTKVSKIQNLGEDIALALAATSVRIEAPIPGKSAVGFEIPNKKVSPVSFKEIMASDNVKEGRAPLTIGLGKDITGRSVATSLGEMPHLLIAGSTGSGKSVCLNTLICSLLFRYTPDELKFLLIDPKKVELTPYNDIPHLVAPVVTDPKRSAVALRWMVSEMESRYEQLANLGVKDIKSYNEIVSKEEQLAYVVVIIDELADLMMAAPVDVETSICRIAQKARAAGIHLVVATQRPSVQVITGDIKSNIPRRIAFAVFSQIDARTILDASGAEKLLGKGDMLFTQKGGKLLRVQGAYISEEEIISITEYLKNQGEPEYLEGSETIETAVLDEGDKGVETEAEDELLKDAAHLILETGQASISMLQRKLRVGYSRGARLIDLLEEKGFVGPSEGAKGREVIGNWEDFGNQFGEH